VRVELHGATETHYTQLHAAMEAQGFARKIQASNGTWYHLPTAEYRYSANQTATDVCTKAYGIAQRVRPNPAVLVTEASNTSWNGLPVVR
jgi:hypothetical protein